VTATSYDTRFYDAIRAGCRASAAAVVPVVLDRVGPVGSVLDVGCGEGWWAQAFHDAGVDSGDVAVPAPDVKLVRQDLTVPIVDPRQLERFDLAVCLEVAEHLPAERAESLVADLCQLAPVVLFSAAMPRQGGTGHINCRPPGYWADLFAARGFTADGSLRWAVWDHPDVEPWYKSNLLLFTAGGDTPTGGARPLHVIHPDLWLENR
jgi:SAM-dependent methyltransferase